MIREFSLSEVWFLLQALRWTIALALIAFVGGSIVGLLVAVGRIAKARAPRALAIGYIKLFQGTPLLMQLYLVYFGANLLGLQTNAWVAAALGLTLYTSAFLGEVWRGCIQAIPKGQWDGARALALGPIASLRFVILPQAMRIALPPTVGFLVQVLKGTSLASIIGFTELTRAAQMVNNATFRPFLVYALVAGLYFLCCWPLSLLSQRLERRLERSPSDRRPAWNTASSAAAA
ncbi:MAG TPA: amino acid ABC transporter permease [Reyranella sp.]|jgi:polar amino acid transport system permease protein